MPSDDQTETVLSLLSRARERFTQRELGLTLSVSPKTISRWERGAHRCPPLAAAALDNILRADTNRKNGEEKFSFIDLFAGIGGMRLGFESIGGRSVFTSEWNPWAKKTYIENHGAEEPFIGDIVPQPAEEIPDHDVLLAGFPCQPFSIRS